MTHTHEKQRKISETLLIAWTSLWSAMLVLIGLEQVSLGFGLLSFMASVLVGLAVTGLVGLLEPWVYEH